MWLTIPILSDEEDIESASPVALNTDYWVSVAPWRKTESDGYKSYDVDLGCMILLWTAPQRGAGATTNLYTTLPFGLLVGYLPGHAQISHIGEGVYNADKEPDATRGQGITRDARTRVSGTGDAS